MVTESQTNCRSLLLAWLCMAARMRERDPLMIVVAIETNKITATSEMLLWREASLPCLFTMLFFPPEMGVKRWSHLRVNITILLLLEITDD